MYAGKTYNQNFWATGTAKRYANIASKKSKIGKTKGDGSMNFTITLNGEGPDLANALRVLKGVMEGQTVLSGEVSATIAPSQPATLAQPIQQAYNPQPSYLMNEQQPQFPQQPVQPVQPQYPQQPVQQPGQPQYPQQPGYPLGQPQPNQTGYANAGGVPLSTVAYTQDQLSVAATQLMDAGRQPELIQLLQQFGVPALTLLPKEHYGEFATRLRALGAKI